MNDLISRQALCEYALNQKDKSVTPNDIMRFPFAQPEPCEDCVSRKVIMQHYDSGEYKHVNHISRNGLLDYIEQLPPAQPEKHTQERTETHACDLISRQAAIDALTRFITPHDNGDGTMTVGVLSKSSITDILNDLPSAQPDMSEYSDKLWKAAYERGKAEAQQRWIPCSERLPEEEQTVLVTCSDGRVYIYDRLEACDYEYDDRRFWEDSMGCYQPREDVIAWMPLPEAYRKGD